MNIDHANKIPVAQILEKLPNQPKRIKANKLLYLSPLHTKTAILLEVDTKTNRWYDHGYGIGGSPVELVCAYLKSTLEAHTELDALRWLANMAVSPDKPMPVCASIDATTPAHTDLELRAKGPIQHAGLIHYLEKHGVPLRIAQRVLKEVRVRQTKTKKSFLVLGFPNEDSGLELSNPFFTGCLGPQAISFIRARTPSPTSIHLFKNVLDYLSVITQLQGQGLTGDTIVLNAMSCLKQALSYIQNYGYRVAYSWLDNDSVGQEATTDLTEFCRTEAGLTHTPMNKLYVPHQDVNAWHMHMHTHNLRM